MFGLTALFAALGRLTRSVNTSADLFDHANEQLRKQLAIDGPAEALEHHAEADAPRRNGRAKTPA